MEKDYAKKLTLIDGSNRKVVFGRIIEDKDDTFLFETGKGNKILVGKKISNYIIEDTNRVFVRFRQ